MTAPGVPRTMANAPTGAKLTSFGDARSVADSGCGGQSNGDPGISRQLMEAANVAYKPGVLVTVGWDLTIPHPDDNENTGVRIAIHYSPEDSFENNVLYGCLEGDEGCDVGNTDNNQRIKSAQPLTGTAQRIAVALPEGKTCTYCTIQFLWAARQDGGFYLGCTDISITTDGGPADFNAVPDQTGKALSTLVVDENGNVTDVSEGGGSSVGVVIGVICGVLAFLIIGYCLYKRMKSGGGGVSLQGKPPPPGAESGAAGLPAGWSAAVDPTSGRTYYVNATTGQTSWEPPAAPAQTTSATSIPPAAPGMQAGAPPLPAGWSAAVDPNSGQTYYMNSITGQTSWEPPVRNHDRVCPDLWAQEERCRRVVLQKGPRFDQDQRLPN